MQFNRLSNRASQCPALGALTLGTLFSIIPKQDKKSIYASIRNYINRYCKKLACVARLCRVCAVRTHALFKSPPTAYPTVRNTAAKR